MSMLSNLFKKNSASSSSNNLNAQSSLVHNPIIANATQMNNEFLHHHKPLLLNQQGTFAQAPIAPIYQSQSSSWGSQRGLSTYQRGGPYRQFRLRTHNWGTRSENGWSGFNASRYHPNNISSWEPQSFILAELRAQSLSQRGLAAPFNQDSFWQQWQQQRFQGWGSQQRGLNSGFGGINSGFGGINSGFGGINNFQQQSFVQQAPLAYSAAPLVAAPATQPILFAGKQGRGHHHGIRKNRAQAVLPVQPIGGGPAIATIAPAPIVAPIIAAPIAPISTRNAGLIQQQSFVQQAPLAAPLHETIVRPTIIQETIRTDRVLEVQPVVHREIEQSVVNHIEKHITEAPAANMGGVVRMAPIVQEITSTRVIDEVQPVVHREVATVAVERVEEHLTEHVVAPTQHTNAVVNEAFIAPVATTASPALSSVPLTNTVPITKVVPNFAAAPVLGSSPVLLEKQAPIVAQPAFGSAMM